MLQLNKVVITPTIFPDRTSQVWKLSESDVQVGEFTVTWYFESEAEFIHLAQLVDLIRSVKENALIDLYLPYLPYARQDKDVSNEASFALHSFSRLLNSLRFRTVTVFDAHSSKAQELIDNYQPDPSLRSVIQQTLELAETDVVCFPDLGAAQRYDFVHQWYPTCSFSKKRDPATGYITNLVLNEDFDLKGHRVTIVDDLCDGGMTFILTAKKLAQLGAINIDLYVSHGLFSKGREVLWDAGITNIYVGGYRAPNSNITL